MGFRMMLQGRTIHDFILRDGELVCADMSTIRADKVSLDLSTGDLMGRYKDEIYEIVLCDGCYDSVIRSLMNDIRAVMDERRLTAPKLGSIRLLGHQGKVRLLVEVDGEWREAIRERCGDTESCDHFVHAEAARSWPSADDWEEVRARRAFLTTTTAIRSSARKSLTERTGTFALIWSWN